MCKQLVVPLDGSLLAEKALPIAVTLAKWLGAELLLLRVITPPRKARVTYEPGNSIIESTGAYIEKLYANMIHTQFDSQRAYTPVQEFTAYDDTEEEAAQLYLETIKASLVKEPGINPAVVHTRIGYGSTPEEIATIAANSKAELIVMTTHGRTGLSRLVTGSVATRALKQSKVPVVLIRPDTELEQTPLLSGLKNRLLLTLDGSSEAEAIIPAALKLARESGATVYLIQVVLPFIPSEIAAGIYNPGYAIEVDTELVKELAYKYLEKMQRKFTDVGVECFKVVRVGTALTEILDFAEKADISMIAMASHARSSVGFVFLGSIADEVVRKSNLPVLMVRSTQHANRRITRKEKVTAS